MAGDLRLQKRDGIRSSGFAEIVERKAGSLTGMHGGASLQVGQGKSGFAVAAIRGPEQGKERGVLRDRHELSVTPCPAFGGEVERKNPNFSDKRIGHKSIRLEMERF